MLHDIPTVYSIYQTNFFFFVSISILYMYKEGDNTDVSNCVLEFHSIFNELINHFKFIRTRYISYILHLYNNNTYE